MNAYEIEEERKLEQMENELTPLLKKFNMAHGGLNFNYTVIDSVWKGEVKLQPRRTFLGDRPFAFTRLGWPVKVSVSVAEVEMALSSGDLGPIMARYNVVLERWKDKVRLDPRRAEHYGLKVVWPKER